MRNPWEEFEFQFKMWIILAFVLGYLLGLFIGKL